MCQIITYFSIFYFTFHPFGYHILLNIWFFLSFFFTCQDLSDKTASPAFKNYTSCLDNCALFGNYIVHLNYRQYLWFFLNKKNFLTLCVINIYQIKVKNVFVMKKNENLLKYGERTFVGINGAVNPITFWKLIVAFSCVMALHNSTNSIEFCAIS